MIRLEIIIRGSNKFYTSEIKKNFKRKNKKTLNMNNQIYANAYDQYY